MSRRQGLAALPDSDPKHFGFCFVSETPTVAKERIVAVHLTWTIALCVVLFLRWEWRQQRAVVQEVLYRRWSDLSQLERPMYIYVECNDLLGSIWTCAVGLSSRNRTIGVSRLRLRWHSPAPYVGVVSTFGWVLD
ncbi:hypothetical protein LY78DRAFT_372552 [Colletotrichum sublineola]|nr:hypothetical protein LY78DRAFT_372552 [Colletotrichum sublineola]